MSWAGPSESDLGCVRRFLSGRILPLHQCSLCYSSASVERPTRQKASPATRRLERWESEAKVASELVQPWRQPRVARNTGSIFGISISGPYFPRAGKYGVWSRLVGTQASCFPGLTLFRSHLVMGKQLRSHSTIRDSGTEVSRLEIVLDSSS